MDDAYNREAGALGFCTRALSKPHCVPMGKALPLALPQLPPCTGGIAKCAPFLQQFQLFWGTCCRSTEHRSSREQRLGPMGARARLGARCKTRRTSQWGHGDAPRHWASPSDLAHHSNGLGPLARMGPLAMKPQLTARHPWRCLAQPWHRLEEQQALRRLRASQLCGDPCWPQQPT
ncbi:hypothetical protein KIL84_021064 [Mauremys mutica]|uniref:Uncharacterized protein n=1 Tax=Mauremys mutica TaxID=74926 RepID=A0A9D3XC51_9SAUR|nr:hypothetical protein KIL84_021064 [Mauremys mutica]